MEHGVCVWHAVWEKNIQNCTNWDKKLSVLTNFNIWPMASNQIKWSILTWDTLLSLPSLHACGHGWLRIAFGAAAGHWQMQPRHMHLGSNYEVRFFHPWVWPGHGYVDQAIPEWNGMKILYMKNRSIYFIWICSEDSVGELDELKTLSHNKFDRAHARHLCQLEMMVQICHASVMQ